MTMPGRLIVFVNPDDTSRHTASANTAIYPNLGLLTLMTATRCHLQDSDEVAYIDGTVFGNDVINRYLINESPRIAVLAVTALTANYGAGREMARLLKEHNPEALTIFGNDHFSAVAERAITNNPEIDFGFYGNDVVEGFANFVTDHLRQHFHELSSYPGLVWRRSDGSVAINQEDPSEYHRLPLVDYGLIDSAMPHRARYLAGQEQTYFFMRERELRSQVIDIGRGCIKFAGPRLLQIPQNACDFCGIIPGERQSS